MENLVAEAARSKLGIVALLFVIAGTLARAFFGRDTPLKIRVIMFSVVLVGLSCFAVAVLIIETPATPNTDYEAPISKDRAVTLRDLLDKFKDTYEGCRRVTASAQQDLQRLYAEVHPPGISNAVPVMEIQVYPVRESVERLKDGCDELEALVNALRIDFQDLPQLLRDREADLSRCRNTHANLRKDLAAIPTQ